MNNLTLATWIQQQTHFGNSADGLAIYALSDMCGVHATIVTKTKPWTTIHPTYSGDVYEALCICKVNMVYLGYNKFARLRKKTNPADRSYITQSYNLPSMVALPAPPTREELETAETLLQLQGTEDEGDQDPSPSNLKVPPTDDFTDAMDKCVDSVTPLLEIPMKFMMHLTRSCSVQMNLRMSYMWKRIQRFRTWKSRMSYLVIQTYLSLLNLVVCQ